jgi:hypothetical protein
MRQKTFTVFAGIILIACSARAESCKSLVNQKSDIVLNISNISELSRAVKESPFGKLSNDPAIKQAFGKPADNLLITAFTGIFKQNLKDEAMQIYTDKIKLLTGALSASLDIETRSSDNNPDASRADELTLQSIKMAAGMTEDGYKQYRRLRNKQADIADEKVVQQHNKYQGVYVYSEFKANKPAKKSWYAWVNNILLFGDSEEWIKESIVKLKKSPVNDKLNAAPHISLQVNIQSVQKRLKLSSFVIGSTKISMQDVLNGCGMNGLKSINYSIKFNKDNLETKNAIDFKKPRKGLLSILEASPTPINLRLPYAPEGVIDYQLFRLTLLPLWKQIPEIIEQVLPKEIATQIIGMIPGILIELGVDPEQDIFAKLGHQWAAVTIDAKPEPLSLLLINVNNERSVQSSLDRIMGVALGLEKKTFHGCSYYEIDKTDKNTPVVAVKSGYLVVGKADAVLQYLLVADSDNIKTKAFYKSRDFAALRSQVPNNAIAYSVVSAKKHAMTFKLLLESLSKAKPAGNAGEDDSTADNNKHDRSGKTNLVKKMFPDLDMSKFPPPEHIAEFFGTSIGYTVLENTTFKTINTIKYGDK